MLSLLSKLTPLALGAAISPILLTAIILILSGRERPLRRGTAFACGALLALAAIGIGVLLAFHGAPGSSDRSHPGSDTVDVAFGVLLLVLAARQVTRILNARGAPSDARSADAETDDDPAVPESGGSILKYFGGGVATMLLNFSTIVIYIPAVKMLAQPGYTTSEQIVGFVYVTLVALTLAIVPIGLFAAAPKSASRALEPVGTWTKSHSKEVGAVLLVVFGVYLLIKGMRG